MLFGHKSPTRTLRVSPQGRVSHKLPFFAVFLLWFSIAFSSAHQNLISMGYFLFFRRSLFGDCSLWKPLPPQRLRSPTGTTAGRAGLAIGGWAETRPHCSPGIMNCCWVVSDCYWCRLIVIGWKQMSTSIADEICVNFFIFRIVLCLIIISRNVLFFLPFYLPIFGFVKSSFGRIFVFYSSSSFSPVWHISEISNNIW